MCIENAYEITEITSEISEIPAIVVSYGHMYAILCHCLCCIVSSWAIVYAVLYPHDSKNNHIRHFIKIPFINKGMDFIDLPSIFRDKSVQSSIPNYFKNCEVPIICYKYNKPIRGAIFNFNKLVSDLNIETCTPDS